MDAYVTKMFQDILSGTMSALQWTTYYNEVSAFGIGDKAEDEIKCAEFYDAVVREFRSYSVKLDRDRYLELVQGVTSISRSFETIWLSRTGLVRIFRLGTQIWNLSSREDDQLVSDVKVEKQKHKKKKNKDKKKKTGNFTLYDVGSLLVLITRFKPSWYKPEVDLMRDDVYEGCKKMAPEIMTNVDWKDFWALMEPVICSNQKGVLYVNLRKFY